MAYSRYLPIAWLFLSTGFLPTGAHCPDNPPPSFELTKPSPDVTIQTMCIEQFSWCHVDTFYQATLLQTLKTRYDTHAHSVLAKVDSVSRRTVYDTLGIGPRGPIIDSMPEESIWMSVLHEFKGALPEKHMFFRERIPAYGPGGVHSFAALIDTPLVAFFDTWESMHQLGIQPSDGCFGEPSAFLVIRGGIEKRGTEQWGSSDAKFPGIAVPVPDFLNAIGGGVAVRPKRDGRTRSPGSMLQGRKVYDALGKKRVEVPAQGALFRNPQPAP